MALGWETYSALPRLTTYADAKQHYDRVKPIRGDAHETRPLGRRDQKWVSVWMNGTTVLAGYGCGELSDRRPIVSWQPDGIITVYTRVYASASTHERLLRLIGLGVSTFNYDSWARCSWYDNGVRKKGHMRLKLAPKAHRVGDTYVHSYEPHKFVREGEELVLLNYSYPVTHILNRKKYNEVYLPYEPFIQFCNGICKLNDGNFDFSDETRGELFGWMDEIPAWVARSGVTRYPNHVPGLHPYADDYKDNLMRWLALARSDDTSNQLRAAIILRASAGYWRIHSTGIRPRIDEHMMAAFKDTIFDTRVHTDGRKVRDRYRSLFI